MSPDRKSTKPPRSTYNRALDMLEARSRGIDELRRLLLRKGEPADEVDAAIERLKAAGLLDDANFARQFARSKALGTGLSKRRLQQELSNRGVNRTTSVEAIEAVFTEEGVSDEASIERVARKKLRTLAKLDAQTQQRRLYSFLARRGYQSDDIARTLRELLIDSGEAE